MTSFCEKHDIKVPNFVASYAARQACSLKKKIIILQWSITWELKYSLLQLIKNYKI